MYIMIYTQYLYVIYYFDEIHSQIKIGLLSPFLDVRYAIQGRTYIYVPVLYK